MKKLFINLLLVQLIWINSVSSQPAILEAMLGSNTYWYQHGISKNLTSTSRFGFAHSSSLHFVYADENLNELMSQSYLTYELTKGIKVAAGTFYASAPGISPALAVQFRIQQNHFRALLVPRIDLRENGAYELMTSLEYTPPVSRRINFYSRVQLMSNYGPVAHNRSYQYVRLGLLIGDAAVGMALNVDERGKEKQTGHNWGLFLRYALKT